MHRPFLKKLSGYGCSSIMLLYDVIAWLGFDILYIYLVQVKYYVRECNSGFLYKNHQVLTSNYFIVAVLQRNSNGYSYLYFC